MDLIRVIILICCCFLTFGSYYSYDLPGALKDDFTVILAQGDSAKSGLFYTFYSLPNCILPFFGGIIIDKVLGLRIGAFTCASLIAVGCCLVAVAGSVNNWEGTAIATMMAITGRFIFGLGGETLSVCQNAFCAKWFQGNDLNLAFAVVLSFSRIGSAVNFAVTPKLSADFGFSFALWTSGALCIFSVIVSICLSLMDYHFENILEKTEADEENIITNSDNDEQKEEEEQQQQQKKLFSITKKRSSSLDNNNTVPLLNEESENDNNFSTSILTDSEDMTINKKDNNSALKVVRAISGTRLILIYLICLQFYVAVFIFVAVAKNFFKDTYASIDDIKAGLLTSLPYTVSAFVSPILGFSMDKIGRGGFFVGLACFSLFLIHTCFAIIPDIVNPTVMMVWLGLTYSTCAASLWPMIAVVCESRNISSAYGLMMSIQNTGLAIAPIFVMRLVPTKDTKIEDIKGNYEIIELIFAVCALCGVFSTIVLYYIDKNNYGGELFAAASNDPSLTDSPYVLVNPLNPRATPFLKHRHIIEAREIRERAVAPKTPDFLRRKYFRRLRIPGHSY